MTDLSKFIRTIPDYPKPGIMFKDITPLLGNAPVFNAVIEVYANHYKDTSVDVIAGPEARGFIFASALAYRMGAGFAPIRKKGKLPYDTHQVTYNLEYGNDTLTIHQDAFPKGSRVLLCDDLLATGGTLAATIELVQKLGGDIVGKVSVKLHSLCIVRLSMVSCRRLKLPINRLLFMVTLSARLRKT